MLPFEKIRFVIKTADGSYFKSQHPDSNCPEYTWDLCNALFYETYDQAISDIENRVPDKFKQKNSGKTICVKFVELE